MVPFAVKCDYVKGVCVITGGTIKCKMPSDVASFVTTGLGVSVLAGIISGVCYILAHGIGNRKRSRKKKSEWYCEICGTYLHSTANILNEDLVTCSKCGAKVCTAKCSKFVQHTRWVCNNCLKPSESWFKGILQAIQPRIQPNPGLSSGLFGPTMMNPELPPNPELDSLRKLEKEQVRDFIEKLVNVMLGENVDNASVSMLCQDDRYQQLFDRYHQDLSNTLTDLGSALHISMSNLPVVGQSPCTAHAALKQLIEKLLKEAVNLPLLQKAHAHPATPPEETTNRTYEDLLATAIINKVVTSCQNNLPSSSTNSVSSSRISTSSKHKGDKEYFFGEETLDTKWKTTDLDTTSVSSLEEWLQSESSFGSKKYVDKVTLMIKQDIEEVENFDSENEENDAEYFRSASSLLDEHESNWYLQKRQFQGTHSPVPVPMLVPNPSTDAKVLIGDKPLDDTSDLSDVGSDFEEAIAPPSTHSLLVQSKSVIGGGKANTFEPAENGDEQSESSTDSGVKEVNGKEQKTFDIVPSEPSKTDISLDDDNVEDSSFISVYSNTEKEAEYTEKYASLPRQILKTSTPKNSYTIVGPDSPNGKQMENGGAHDEDSSDCEFLGGNYSKKEKEKWRHAIEMKNNPYSKENIERRIKRSSSAAGSIFGPDYYAKLAGKPSGGEKLVASEINGVSWPPPEIRRSRTPSPPPDSPKVIHPPKEYSHTDSAPPLEEIIIKLSPAPRNFIQVPTDSPPEPPKTGPPPRELIESNNDIHKALKAVVVTSSVDDDSDHHHLEMNTQEIKPSEVYKVESYPSVQPNTPEVTSDSDLSFINFYDVEHSQVVKKSRNEDIHIPIKHTPLGVSYKSLPDENEEAHINVVHNNNAHNNLIHHTRNENNNVVKEVPVAKPRGKKENGLYVKAASATKQRNISSGENPFLRRHLSESSLVNEDSFDAPPKALHQKKDNTLISKIYKDPKVRLFAFHSREEHHVPGTDGEYIKPPASHSENSSLFLSKGKSYNNSSDDGITSEYESGKTGKMSFFSSEEDLLLSLNSELSFRPTEVVATKNEDVKLNESLYTTALPARDRTPSPNPMLTPRTPSTRKFIYGSQEDLLSIDEVVSTPRRKDNTLISKIYKDAKVRNFAIKAHRDIVPDYQPITPKPREILSSDEEHHYHTNNKIIAIQKPALVNKKIIYSSYDDLSSAEISIEAHQNHQDAIIPSLDGVEDGYKSEDLMDVDELSKRRVVREALGNFSKSEMNLRSTFQRSTSLEEGDGVRVSVRELRKKFENNDVSSKPVISSLTARSLSKHVKEILKQ